MPEKVSAGPVDSSACIREAVCVSTRKIFDSCRDKDCVDDLRVYPIMGSQAYIDNALSIRPRDAKLLHIGVSVNPISFNRGYYAVDCTYFYKVTGEAFPSGELCTGLCVFDKRVMLFGSEGGTRTYSSDSHTPSFVSGDLPRAVVSCVEPLCLHMKLTDSPAPLPADNEERRIPQFIADAFPEALVLGETGKRWLATIGQFSMIRLERDTQLLIPAYDYCLPEKECPGASEDDPCALFSRIRFPVEEFFPPDTVRSCDDYRSLK